MSVGVMKDYKQRNLRASHTLGLQVHFGLLLLRKGFFSQLFSFFWETTQIETLANVTLYKSKPDLTPFLKPKAAVLSN